MAQTRREGRKEGRRETESGQRSLTLLGLVWSGLWPLSLCPAGSGSVLAFLGLSLSLSLGLSFLSCLTVRAHFTSLTCPSLFSPSSPSCCAFPVVALGWRPSRPSVRPSVRPCRPHFLTSQSVSSPMFPSDFASLLPLLFLPFFALSFSRSFVLSFFLLVHEHEGLFVCPPNCLALSLSLALARSHFLPSSLPLFSLLSLSSLFLSSYLLPSDL